MTTIVSALPEGEVPYMQDLMIKIVDSGTLQKNDIRSSSYA